MSELEEAARAFVRAEAHVAERAAHPEDTAYQMHVAERAAALIRLQRAVEAEEAEATKADDRAAMREYALSHADRLEGEPPLDKFARVWDSGSL